MQILCTFLLLIALSLATPLPAAGPGNEEVKPSPIAPKVEASSSSGSEIVQPLQTEVEPSSPQAASTNDVVRSIDSRADDVIDPAVAPPGADLDTANTFWGGYYRPRYYGGWGGGYGGYGGYSGWRRGYGGYGYGRGFGGGYGGWGGRYWG